MARFDPDFSIIGILSEDLIERVPLELTKVDYVSKACTDLYGADKEFIEEIGTFAQLHDIGKIKIAEIIRIPRKLTDSEFEALKKHPLSGGKSSKDLMD